VKKYTSGIRLICEDGTPSKVLTFLQSKSLIYLFLTRVMEFIPRLLLKFLREKIVRDWRFASKDMNVVFLVICMYAPVGNK
jgi:hypothetical protein